MTDTDRESPVRVFSYDVWMLRSTLHWIRRIDGDGPIQNALIESFLVHARALHDVFCRRLDAKGKPREPQRDDVTPEDLIGPKGARLTHTTCPPPLDELQRIVNKGVAHQTTVRPLAKLPNPLVQIEAALLALANKVKQELDTPKLKDWLGDGPFGDAPTLRPPIDDIRLVASSVTTTSELLTFVPRKPKG